jgi:hypothetical protein
MSTTQKFAYVSNAGGKTEFEIHGATCSHLKRIRQNVFADITILSAESAQALVDAEVATYQEQDQGYEHSDFRILPCAQSPKAPAETPTEELARLRSWISESNDLLKGSK